MNKKSHTLLYAFTSVLLIFGLELFYLQESRAIDVNSKEKKVAFVTLVGLPDLAISTQNYASRHRTLSGVFETYENDPSLREYSYSSFSSFHSTIQNPKRATDEK